MFFEIMVSLTEGNIFYTASKRNFRVQNTSYLYTTFYFFYVIDIICTQFFHYISQTAIF